MFETIILRVWPLLIHFLIISHAPTSARTEWSSVLNPPTKLGHLNHYYMAELILLKSNWAAQNHDILPLSFLLPLGWHKNFGPRAKLLVPSAPLPLSCLLGGTRTLAQGPNFLCHLPLSLPAASWVAQELWPKGQTSCAINNAGFS